MTGRAVRGSRIGLLLLVAASAIVATLSIGLAFRTPFDGIALGLEANGARQLLAAAAGAALAISAVLGQAAGRRALFDPTLFAVACGGALGLALASKILGAGVAALVCGGLAALAAGGLVAAVDRERRGANIGLGLLLAALLAAAVPTALMAASEEGRLGGLALWLLGDVAHAGLAGATIVLVTVAGLVAIAARCLPDVALPLAPGALAGERRVATIGVLLFGVAVGVAGPVAFVGWFAPIVVAVAVPAAARARSGLLLAGAVGAALLMSADALPRLLIGGYAPPLNVSIGVVAVPSFLVWNRRRLRASGATAGRLFDAVELVLVIALVLVLAFLVQALTGFVRAAA